MTTSHDMYENLELDRRRFETDLAVCIIQDPTSIATTVKKVSLSILSLIQMHKKLSWLHDRGRFIDLFKPNSEFCKTLYNKYAFGRLGDTAPVDTDEVFAAVEKRLTDDLLDVPLVLHIHSAFFQHVYPNLNEQLIQKHAIIREVREKNNSDNPDDVCKASRVFSTNQNLWQPLRKAFYLYNTRERAVTTNDENLSCDALGILTKETPNWDAKKYPTRYVRAIDKMRFVYTNDYAAYIAKVTEHKIPIITGPSGHIGILMRGAIRIGQFNKCQMHEYLLACVAMIVGGGMHGFHEMMHIADGFQKKFAADCNVAQSGILASVLSLNYEDGSYLKVLPSSFKESENGKRLILNHLKMLSHVEPEEIKAFKHVLVCE